MPKKYELVIYELCWWCNEGRGNWIHEAYYTSRAFLERDIKRLSLNELRVSIIKFENGISRRIDYLYYRDTEGELKCF